MFSAEQFENEQFGVEHFLLNGGENKVEIKEDGEYSREYKNPKTENHVGYQLKALNNMFCRNMQAMMRQNDFEDRSLMNAWIIEYLAYNEERDIFQKDIEKNFKVGKSTIAGTLKMMEEKGYILRRAVEGDARLKKVCLTDKGRTYAYKMEQGREYMEQKVCKGLTEEEISLFFQVIKKMQDNLSE